MKNKQLLIVTLIFFLTVNTSYYWEAKIGIFELPVFMLLACVFIGLVVILFGQIYHLIKEKFRDKQRVFIVGILACILTLTIFKPFGLIDFEKLEGVDLFVAEREGAANCMTTLKLKDDFTFKEKNRCFGTTEISGRFYLKNDTICFDNVNLGRQGGEFYKFAVIQPSKFSNNKIMADLVMYMDLSDTTGRLLWIAKNELNKLKNKKPNR